MPSVTDNIICTGEICIYLGGQMSGKLLPALGNKYSVEEFATLIQKRINEADIHISPDEAIAIAERLDIITDNSSDGYITIANIDIDAMENAVWDAVGCDYQQYRDPSLGPGLYRSCHRMGDTIRITEEVRRAIYDQRILEKTYTLDEFKDNLLATLLAMETYQNSNHSRLASALTDERIDTLTDSFAQEAALTATPGFLWARHGTVSTKKDLESIIKQALPELTHLAPEIAHAVAIALSPGQKVIPSSTPFVSTEEILHAAGVNIESEDSQINFNQLDSEVKMAGLAPSSIVQLLAKIDAQLPIIEAYLANPQLKSVSNSEASYAMIQAAKIRDHLKDVRSLLSTLARNWSGATGRTFHSLSEALRNRQLLDAIKTINSNLSQFMTHVRNNIAHDMGRDFLPGINSATRKLTGIVNMKLLENGLQSVRVKCTETISSTSSLLRQATQTAASSARAAATAASAASRTVAVGTAQRAWRSATNNSAVRNLIQASRNNPYAKPVVIAGAAIAVGAAAWYYFSE